MRWELYELRKTKQKKMEKGENEFWRDGGSGGDDGQEKANNFRTGNLSLRVRKGGSRVEHHQTTQQHGSRGSK